MDPAEDRLEAFETFEENALAKARYFHRVSGGRATVADDSGLEVCGLAGAPGVRSRRWSGAVGNEAAVSAANVAHLLRVLDGAAERRARFICVLAYVDAEREVTCRGEVWGEIALAGRGTAGFGYDPVFVPADADGRTFAELPPAHKARISHRARAVHALEAALRTAASRPVSLTLTRPARPRTLPTHGA
jgi:XTP/dITP diphosphohydrolase